jgi:hypothetical protein
MGLTLVLLSIGLLVYGTVTRSLVMNIIGAGAFIISICIDLVHDVSSMKSMGNGLSDTESKEMPGDKLARILKTIVTFGGLVYIYIGMGQLVDGEDVWSWPGLIIWVGVILLYLINGWIVRAKTGLPLRMGYGGWYVARTRRGRTGLHTKSYNKYVRRR